MNTVDSRTWALLARSVLGEVLQGFIHGGSEMCTRSMFENSGTMVINRSDKHRLRIHRYTKIIFWPGSCSYGINEERGQNGQHLAENMCTNRTVSSRKILTCYLASLRQDSLSCLLVPIRSQMQQVYNFPLYFPKIHSNVILPCLCIFRVLSFIQVL
jgi:hypothetical protein